MCTLYTHINLDYIYLGMKCFNFFFFFSSFLCHDLIRNIEKKEKKILMRRNFQCFFILFLRKKKGKISLCSLELLLAWDLSDKTIIWSLLLLWLMVHIKGSNGRWRYGNAFMWLFLLYLFFWWVRCNLCVKMCGSINHELNYWQYEYIFSAAVYHALWINDIEYNM